MSRPPAARDAVLDAFEGILIEAGERAATLDATAKAAGVSKGGLLYHFANREALVEGVLERFSRLVDEDITVLELAPEGPVAYYVRSSVTVGGPLDRAGVAATRLAQAGHESAAQTIRSVRQRWLEAVRRHVADPTVALAITLIGDGLYYDSALHGQDPELGVDAPPPAQLDALVALLERLATTP
ncbi:AcrR family transcriptional regulator [Agromyces flavus]|uniref:AcrR family transcriptional regulator n=1 Tax=Agromyces flavus TaxID=589382 RepID=A0A1H1PIG3_9MICO|nr:TetR/AcrR family transcriptional regulator [Agromyces flavus]MCP2367913.1 AcrR family transcriptional regulator [Agromyces flavus]GGI47375.1 TetR family transcriptional regulator [Agromyces flavus]SDS11068.1 DNA-binding transcriptional regulator, AcrR family [Agromyces flavus]